ncbi:MAG: CDP-diacylglycerol--glycerol-3-phosphate 3-phosphatidyltransferase [Deltaproteobacteria bacterium]
MKRDARLNPPNLLTLFRIVIVPVVVLLLYVPGGEISFPRSLAAFVLYVVATLTDLLDGYLARRYQMITPLGKLLDPLADKLLVCAALIMLVPPGRVAAWMVVIVVAREIGVTALRGVASTEGVIIAASALGKWKTLLLNIGVAALILHYPFFGVEAVFGPRFVHWFGIAFLAGGIVLTAWSGLDYFLRFLGEVFHREGPVRP